MRIRSVHSASPLPDADVQRAYRVRIVAFLIGIVLFLVVVDALYKGVNTIARLNVVEADRDRWQRSGDAIAALSAKDGSVVAEIGAGAGYFALKLSRPVGPSGQVIAEDVRRFPLLFLRIRALLRGEHNVHVRVGDADDPGLPPESVDAFLIANTYHEFANPQRMLDHIARSLRPRGRIVVLDRSREGGDLGVAEHRHELRPEVVDSHFREKGFEIVHRDDRFIVRWSGEQWWLMIAQKPTN